MVSVIIPVYNREKTLEECLNSVLAQSYKDLEVVLIDDGSTDASLKICESFAIRDSRVKVLKAVHGGVSAARNVGIDNSVGELIFFVDSDDVIHPNTVEELVAGFAESGAALGGCNVLDVPQRKWEQTVKNKMSAEPIAQYEYKPFADALDAFFTVRCPINLIGGTMVKRSFMENTRFKTDLFIGEDFYFVYENLLKGADCVFINEKRYLARIHKNNSSWIYTFDGFYTRFYRRALVWRSEENNGRKKYADLQKRDAFSSFNRCIRKIKPYSADAKLMRKELKKHRREMSSGLDFSTNVLMLVAIYMPFTYSLLNKLRAKIK